MTDHAIPNQIPDKPVPTTPGGQLPPAPRATSPSMHDPHTVATGTLLVNAGIAIIAVFGSFGTGTVFNDTNLDPSLVGILGVGALFLVILWLTGLVSAHIGVARRSVYYGVNRTKMIWALVLAYIPVLVAIILVLITLLFLMFGFGLLLLLAGGAH